MGTRSPDAERPALATPAVTNFHRSAYQTPDRNPTQGLRDRLEKAAANVGCGLGDLTVLAVQNDPFRVDTPAGHRDGAWLANTLAGLGLGDRQVHCRGAHYMLIGQAKPDGKPYTNTDSDWTWLSGTALKSARWLGYLSFDQIVDQRNAAPEIQIFTEPIPMPYLNVGIDVEIPDAEDIAPQIGVSGFAGTQPYKIVLFGEKSSLAPVLGPIAKDHRADLYLPTGEISDTLMHTMAKTAATDGRPMIVLTFSDADPAGWQMPISIARKLQAFESLFPNLDYEVRRVALTPDQVREYGLPSTPLKETERRGDKWRTAMLTDQTEIDALASLQPDLLRRIARDAIAPFFDRTLDRRVRDARSRWIAAAQAIVDANTDADLLARLREEAAERLTEMRAQIDAINEACRVDVDEFDISDPVIPAAEADGPTGLPLPLIDSRWDHADQCRRLIAAKNYEDLVPEQIGEVDR